MEEQRQMEPMEEQKPPVGKEMLQEGMQILEEYKKGKKNLEERLIVNEEFWKLNHWEQFKASHMNENDPRPTSGWLFNAVNNKHADAMDNYPEPNILPREESDKPAAKQLSEIIPTILEINHFEDTYSQAWWDKLKGGTAVYGVFWNNRLMNGLGDVDIRSLELLNIFWEPGIMDIQQSRNLFLVELADREVLEELYPGFESKGGRSFNVSEYHYDDTVDTSKKVAVIDWYYKKNGKLHYIKFAEETLLYASENEEAYRDRGFYDDGMYPVIFDTLFPEKGTPAGFGYIDIMKDPQMYIDKMDSAFLKNAVLLSKPRYFVKDNAAINGEEFADFSKDFIHVASGTVDDTGIRKVEVDDIPSTYLQIKNDKVEELKENSGNRDFSQGSTTSGVTAASAIAALQEAGSKTSRDMIKGAYRAYARICEMVIERIRQFYTEPRSFRIIGPNGAEQFVLFQNAQMQIQGAGTEYAVELAGRLPVFDVKVRPQKQSPFSKIAQNELAKELFGAGIFNPALADQAYACVDMMDFEGKEQVIQKIQQNGLMYQQIQQMQASMAQMAALLAQTTGDTRIMDALQGNMLPPAATAPRMEGEGETVTNSLGEVKNKTENSQAGKARARVAEAATPKV